MKIQAILLTAALFGLTFTAQAASNYQICSDSEGAISVENGNVTIKDGIGNVGPAKSQKVLKTISAKTESCVDGPNYVATTITVEKVIYNLEEGVSGSAIVLCTRNQTGIVPPGTECK